MIPRTFPSSRASNGSTQMIVYFLPSVSGLTRWVDYIPVKFTTVATAATENTYNQNGYIPVVSISSIAGATPFKEYVPVFLDSSAADADVWDVNITGFIPVGTAGIGGAALYMDFAATTTLDPRITFSRTTNATLTNSAGLVANAPMNLLTFSEQFDNAAWTSSGTVTVTANNAVAPNGTTTAEKISITALTAGGEAGRTQTFTSQVATYTASYYIKPDTLTTARIGLFDGVAFGSQDFTFSTKTFGNTRGTLVISSVGYDELSNGWFRLYMTIRAVNASASANIGLFGAATGSAWFWGAQLELGSTATTYNPTTIKNLLGFTEHFDNAAWTKSNASISATKVDDIYGQPFAQKLVENTANGAHVMQVNVSGLVSGSSYVASVYAKAGERTKFDILAGAGTGTGSTVFDLVAVTATGGGTITDVGGGWYRCSVTLVPNSGLVQFLLRLYVGASASYIGDGTSGIYIFGAQLSDSASVDPYVYQPVAAPSSVAYYGPRFDYDPVTLAPKGLLIEEQRTNLLLQSETFDNASWAKSNATVTANAVVSPDGTADAETLTENTTANYHFLQQAVTTTVNQNYALSVYAKNNSGTYLNVSLFNNGSAALYAAAVFNLSTGAVTTTGAVGAGYAVISASMIETPVGSGWYRCNCVLTNGSVSAANQIAIAMNSSGTIGGFGLETYTGTSRSIYIWGAQLEAGAFATSYIPTVASQVTRAADSASMIGNNFARWYNVNEGSVFASFIPSQNSNTPSIWGQSTADTSGGYFAAQFNHWNGAATLGNAGAITLNQTNKTVLAYTGTASRAGTANAVAVTTSATTVGTFNTIRLGATGGSTQFLNGTIKQFSFYPRRLSNTELQSITS